MQNGRKIEVHLEPVTRDNFMAVVRLSVAPEQQGYVASNAFSLAESKYYPELKPFAIYDRENLVGFLMYGLDEDSGRVWIVRLMVATGQQGMGYGRAAMNQAIAAIRQAYPNDELYISFEPENEVAGRLYTSLGFEPTGEWDGSETVYRLKLG
ncbi:MAG TPA: GNAT family N-acetyltransferase [Anaerolineaceae bacterium]|nr:GNAT family N-acetyltransferase [Anaerolineaceae bacterium]